VLEDIQAQRATKVLSVPDGLVTLEGLATTIPTPKRLELGGSEVEASFRIDRERDRHLLLWDICLSDDDEAIDANLKCSVMED